MKIKVYGWAHGRPVKAECETLQGGDAQAIVQAMMMTPFAANLTPREYMERTLAGIGRGGVTLPQDAPAAAEAYLAASSRRGPYRARLDAPRIKAAGRLHSTCKRPVCFGLSLNGCYISSNRLVRGGEAYSRHGLWK